MAQLLLKMVLQLQTVSFTLTLKVFPNKNLITSITGASQRKKAWSKRARLPLARSYAAICGGPDGKVYCIGGWAGQPGIKDCHVYSTDEDVWNEMPLLNTGKYYTNRISMNLRSKINFMVLKFRSVPSRCLRMGWSFVGSRRL